MARAGANAQTSAAEASRSRVASSRAQEEASNDRIAALNAALETNRAAMTRLVMGDEAPSATGTTPRSASPKDGAAAATSVNTPWLMQSLRIAVRQWWRRHPLQPVATAGEAIVRQQIEPYAQQRPWMLLGTAAGAGALAMLCGPKRLLAWAMPLALIDGRTVLQGVLSAVVRDSQRP